MLATCSQLQRPTAWHGAVPSLCVPACVQSGYVSLQDVADVELNAGDILLLEADQGFRKRFQYNSAFGLVSCCSRSWHLAAAAAAAAVCSLHRCMWALPQLTTMRRWPMYQRAAP